MKVVMMRHYLTISLFALACAVYLRWNSFPYGQFDVIILSFMTLVSFLAIFQLPHLIDAGVARAISGFTFFACSLAIMLVVNVLSEHFFVAVPISVFPMTLCLLGIFELGSGVSAWVKQRFARTPPTPFFFVDKNRVGCLELGGGGTYEECQRFLCELRDRFHAEFSKRLDAGSNPHSDKEKGYWDVNISGQKFLVMRERGNGMCVWGSKTLEGLAEFLRIANHFGATEFVTLRHRMTRHLIRKLSY